MPSAKAATYNNLFAGYVRVQDIDEDDEMEVTVACDASNLDNMGVIPEDATYVTPNSATALSNVEVRAEFGTNYYNTTDGFVTALDDTADTADNDYYEQYYGYNTEYYSDDPENTWAAAGASYDVVSDDGSDVLGEELTAKHDGYTAIWYSEDGDSDMVAKTGTYTIRYRLTYDDGKEGIPKGTTLTVGDGTYSDTVNSDDVYENTIALTWTGADSNDCSATATYTTDTQLTNMDGSWTVGSVTSGLVKGSKISLTYTADGEGTDGLASGSYTFEITSITTGETVGATVKTPGFSAKVTNSLVLPKVNVTTRTADSLSSDDIIKCLETNVDMNNNTKDEMNLAQADALQFCQISLKHFSQGHLKMLKNIDVSIRKW